MVVGIDLSPLQSGHRMRGIGFTVLNFINNISDADKNKNHYILFLYAGGEGDVLRILDLRGMDYEVRYLREKKAVYKNDQTYFSERVNRLLRSSIRQIRELADRYLGNYSIGDSSDLDVFIQPDQSASLPKGRKIKKVLIIYDIIPYVLEWEYLWSYSTARMHGYSWKASIRCKARRWLYIKKLKINIRRADLLLAISKTTKDDFVRFAGAESKKIVVTHLGVGSSWEESENANLFRYFKTSWGYIPKKYKHDPDTPFILYVGGADRRRRIDELVSAFNSLRAEGIKINLFLSGDTMQGPENIATEEIQGALKTSSYLEDIIFTGFTTDETRNWMYQNCMAFVYPSKYEGFGLPILEAMVHGCPVICYHNKATAEVAEDLPLYADNHEGLREQILKLYSESKSELESIRQINQEHALKFNWPKTSKNIMAALERFNT